MRHWMHISSLYDGFLCRSEYRREQGVLRSGPGRKGRAAVRRLQAEEVNVRACWCREMGDAGEARVEGGLFGYVRREIRVRGLARERNIETSGTELVNRDGRWGRGMG